ncbi:MAG: phosphonate C-P lyase system protein PhnG [Geminicoccaceae bacterium]
MAWEEDAGHARRAWMATLSLAPSADLQRHWQALSLSDLALRTIRPPATALVAVRGRVSGTGVPFDLGDVTVTRCAVMLDDRLIGYGYRLGRDNVSARLAASADALLQDTHHAEVMHDRLIAPLQQIITAHRRQRAGRAEATRVDFFTLLRGESP